jgi:hypothetical protein
MAALRIARWQSTRVAQLGCVRVDTRFPYRTTTPRRLFDYGGFQKADKVSEDGWTIRSTVLSGSINPNEL